MKHAGALAVVFTVIICGIAAVPVDPRDRDHLDRDHHDPDHLEHHHETDGDSVDTLSSSLERGLEMNPEQQPIPHDEYDHRPHGSGESGSLYVPSTDNHDHQHVSQESGPMYTQPSDDHQQPPVLPPRNSPMETSYPPPPTAGDQQHPISQPLDPQFSNPPVEGERENPLHDHIDPEREQLLEEGFESLPEQPLETPLGQQSPNGLFNRLQGMPSRFASTLQGIIPEQIGGGQNDLFSRLQGMPSQLASSLQGMIPGQNGGTQNGAGQTGAQQDNSPFGFLSSLLPFGQSGENGSGLKEGTAAYHLGQAAKALLSLRLFR